MKSLSSLLVCFLLCFTSVAFAGNDMKAQQNQYELQPIYSLNARNAQRITVNLTYDNFSNVSLEEADEFDGYTTTAELVVPFGKDKGWEVRLEVPFHTEGEATVISTNESIDIEGDAGVFNFANIVLQREISTADKCPVNTSLYMGYGRRTQYLETTIDDVYNHTGNFYRLGFNIDNARADRDLRVQASLDSRYYFDSDDLNPSDNGTEFYIVNLSGGVVYNADWFIKPAFEVLYSTDFGDRSIIQAVPEFIIPIGDMLEIKGGFAFGESDGAGATQTGTIRTTFKF